MRFRSLKAATSEIYYAIYNINLNTDYMEQISEPNKMYKIANDRGIASEKLMDFVHFRFMKIIRKKCESSLTCQHWGTVKREELCQPGISNKQGNLETCIIYRAGESSDRIRNRSVVCDADY